MFVCNLSCAMKPGFGWTDGRTERTIANAASTDIRYWKKSWIMTWWWPWSYLGHQKSSDNCGWAGAAVVAVNQHRALALTLSFGFTTESDLGCDGWLKRSRVWCSVWENPGQHLGDEGKDGRQVWKQVLSREVSHLIIIIIIGHLAQRKERKPFDKYALAWSDWWKLVMVR